MQVSFVRNLPGFRGDACLYKLSEPIYYCLGYDDEGAQLKERTIYIVISAATVFGPETYIFPANREAHILSWMELPGSIRGVLDHHKAIQKFIKIVEG